MYSPTKFSGNFPKFLQMVWREPFSQYLFMSDHDMWWCIIGGAILEHDVERLGGFDKAVVLDDVGMLVTVSFWTSFSYIYIYIGERTDMEVFEQVNLELLNRMWSGVVQQKAEESGIPTMITLRSVFGRFS
jgi:hypothetical protein